MSEPAKVRIVEDSIDVGKPELVKISNVAIVNFDVLYPERILWCESGSRIRTAWCEWFRRHTIDPMMVRTDGTLAVDFDRYRISYPSYDPDADGWVEMQRELQLEARPSEPPCF